MLVLKLCPRGGPACVGCHVSLCWRKGGGWWICCTLPGSCSPFGSGLPPRIASSWGHWKYLPRTRVLRLTRRKRLSCKGEDSKAWPKGLGQDESRGSDCQEPVLLEGVLRAHPPYAGAGESGSKGTRGPQTSHTVLLRRRWDQSTTAE